MEAAPQAAAQPAGEGCHTSEDAGSSVQETPRRRGKRKSQWSAAVERHFGPGFRVGSALSAVVTPSGKLRVTAQGTAWVTFPELRFSAVRELTFSFGFEIHNFGEAICDKVRAAA